MIIHLNNHLSCYKEFDVLTILKHFLINILICACATFLYKCVITNIFNIYITI